MWRKKGLKAPSNSPKGKRLNSSSLRNLHLINKRAHVCARIRSINFLTYKSFTFVCCYGHNVMVKVYFGLLPWHCC